MKNRKISVEKYEPSKVAKFRKYWEKKGYDLVNITYLLKPKLGLSGWCNDFNEPDEVIYHIQLMYREVVVVNILANHYEVIDDDKYVVFTDYDEDFIVFRKVKIE